MRDHVCSDYNHVSDHEGRAPATAQPFVINPIPTVWSAENTRVTLEREVSVSHYFSWAKWCGGEVSFLCGLGVCLMNWIWSARWLLKVCAVGLFALLWVFFFFACETAGCSLAWLEECKQTVCSAHSVGHKVLISYTNRRLNCAKKFLFIFILVEMSFCISLAAAFTQLSLIL